MQFYVTELFTEYLAEDVERNFVFVVGHFLSLVVELCQCRCCDLIGSVLRVGEVLD